MTPFAFFSLIEGYFELTLNKWGHPLASRSQQAIGNYLHYKRKISIPAIYRIHTQYISLLVSVKKYAPDTHQDQGIHFEQTIDG